MQGGNAASAKAIAALLSGLALASAAPAAENRPGAGWSDYRAIIWHPQKPGSCAALKEVGIDAGAVIAEDRDQPGKGIEERTAPLRDCGLSWYVENIATDFYSAYHRYTPGKPVNWRFIEAKKAYRDDPRDPRAFIRDPSLSDPSWQEKIRDRLARTVLVHRAHAPLFYDLGDEPGIADVSAFWDFDLSPHSVEGMRRWLKERYGTLAALNAQWGSAFAGWDGVVPMTTAQAMKRSDGNYSAWADFKEWMDAEFARSLALGTQAVHAADPRAYAAIEGGQIPGWGGYDYTRLAAAVDVMELYDDGGNVEIARALNPRLVVLRTSYGGPAEARELWRSLLRGGRGVIFWDPKGEIVGADGRAGDRGRSLAPHLREIKAGIGARLIRARRQTAPVAVLYSPASLRIQWMLDWQPKSTAWSDRRPGEVYEDASAVRASMTGFIDFMGRVGLEARIVTPASLEQDALRRGIRVLILPRVLALSEREAAEIRRFAEAGGTVIADGLPGAFDEHCRRRESPLLAGLFRERPGKGRALLFDAPARRGGELVKILAEAGVEPMFTLERANGARAFDIETQLWRDGASAIIGLQRAAAGAPPAPVVLTLREAARVTDLRAKRVLGTAKRFELEVGAVAPALLEIAAP
ncbi:MAG TPA: alpha-amylase family protein [Burkholderiales bacterium]|nr:alpha-amylase family protein [Burkholderiales bacterium]